MMKITRFQNVYFDKSTWDYSENFLFNLIICWEISITTQISVVNIFIQACREAAGTIFKPMTTKFMILIIHDPTAGFH
jgi:hypothetical protein